MEMQTQPTEHTMSIMNHEGDFKVRWDPTNPESVKMAEAAYADHIGQGMRAYNMASGTQGEIMDAFDPTASEILFLPQMRGG